MKPVDLLSKFVCNLQKTDLTVEEAINLLAAGVVSVIDTYTGTHKTQMEGLYAKLCDAINLTIENHFYERLSNN